MSAIARATSGWPARPNSSHRGAAESSGGPGLTKSMRIAAAELGLHRLWVVYPGLEVYPLDKKTMVVPLAEIRERLRAG
jgi:hypothetical protein